MVELEKPNEILNPYIHIGLYFSWFHSPCFLINTGSMNMISFCTCDFFRSGLLSAPHVQMCSWGACTWACLPPCLKETTCGVGMVPTTETWDWASLVPALSVDCTPARLLHSEDLRVRRASYVCLLCCSQPAEMQSSESNEIYFEKFTLEGLWTVCVLYKIFTTVISWYNTILKVVLLFRKKGEKIYLCNRLLLLPLL